MKSNNYLCSSKFLLVFAICFIFSVSMVSGFEFDNIKNFEKDVGSYGKYTIRNSILGIPFLQLDKIIELELKENSEFCHGFKCGANTSASMYEEGVLIQDIRFKYIRGGVEYYDTLSYKLFIKKQKGDWKRYDIGEVVEAGDYEIKLEGTLPDMFTTIDWQIKSQAYWTEMWAEWTSGLNQNLLSYWNMTNITSEFHIPDLATSLSNITVNRSLNDNFPNMTAGVLGFAQRGFRTNKSILNVTTNVNRLADLNRSFSIMLWINNSRPCAPIFFFLGNENFAMGLQKELIGGCQLYTTSTTNGGVAFSKTAGVFLNDSKWHQVGIVVNASNGIKSYYDGVLNMTNHTLSTTSINGSMFRTGTVPVDASVKVWTEIAFDEMGVWDRELTDAEILQLYNSGNALTFKSFDIGVDLSTPEDNNETFATDITFSANLSSFSGTLDNATLHVWFSNDSLITNFTTISGSDYVVNQSFSDLSLDTLKWNYQACSSGPPAECGFAFNNFTLITKNFIENSITFNTETTEGAEEEFILNITLSDDAILSSAIFWYNNTPHGSILLSSGNERIVNNLITIPDVGPPTNNTFFWQLFFNSGPKNTTRNNQSVSNLSIDDCSTNNNVIYNYTLIDEEAQTNISANTSIELFINIFSLDRTISILNFSNNFSNINPVGICLNVNISNSSVSYVVDSTVKYQDDNHVIEYFNILNSTLDNQTATQETSLFDLLIADSTEFLITFTGADFLPVENALIFIKRQYVDENLFKIVEVPKTDSSGQTLGHLVRNDIVYNIDVTKDGVVVGSFPNIIAFCEDFGIGDCKINLDASSTGEPVFDYNQELGITFTGPTFDNLTRTITFNFLSVDGTAKRVLLNTTRNDIFGNVSVCDTFTFSTGATMTCTIPEHVIDTLIISNVIVDGVPAVKAYFNLDQLNFGTAGFYIFFIYMLAFILMFAKSKEFMLIGIVLGFITGIALGLINGLMVGTGASGIWIIIVVVLMAWKLNKKRAD